MKKVDTEILEKMAKDKNIDKDRIEQIAEGYKGKSENELMDELVKIGKTLEGKDQVVSKLKAFLNEDQRKKLDAVMEKIYDAEVKDKIESKKNKSKNNNQSNGSSNTKKVKKTKSSKNAQSSPVDSSNEINSNKKTKKVVKKVKKISKDE